MLLQPRLEQPPWAEEDGSFGPAVGGEEQEKGCQGCKPRQSQGSGLPACTKQGGLFQLTNPRSGLSSPPILIQNLPPISVQGQEAVTVVSGMPVPCGEELTRVQHLLRGGCNGCPVFEHQPMGWMSG